MGGDQLKKMGVEKIEQKTKDIGQKKPLIFAILIGRMNTSKWDYPCLDTWKQLSHQVF